MLFGALAVTGDPGQIPAQLRAELLGKLRGAAYPLGGIKPGLDALGQLHLLLRVEQRDLADLLEIYAYRISRDAGFGVPAGLAQRRGLLRMPEKILRILTTGFLRIVAVHRDLLDL